MSAITPPSYIDDGDSFTNRLSHGLHPAHIANWIDATSTSTSTSTYTGSFIDDGADMLLPLRHTPGFGHIDSQFYKERERKEGRDGVWNEDVQRAVSGDIQRNLERLKGFGGVEVKRERKRKGEKRDGVTIPAPLKWGSVVIKAEGGRVIVVDRDGEFDSGPQKTGSEKAGRWVKGLSTIEPPSPTEVSKQHDSAHGPEEHLKDESKGRSRKHSHSRKHKKSRHKHHSSSPHNTLAPILESAYESGYLVSSGEEVLSPTGFFMAGGANGWPSRTATSVASPAHSASKTYNFSIPGSRSKSPIHSPPGAWPSPALSLLKSAAASEQHWGGGGVGNNWKEDKSRHSERSEKSHRSRKSARRSHQSRREETRDFDNMSTKSSIYKPPTVEEAPDTSSSERKGRAATGWGGKESEKGWNESKKGSEGGWAGSEHGSKKSNKVASQTGWGGSQRISEKSWKEHAKPMDDDNWHTNDKQSETSWDGFEKVKTLSEISVAGSGSDCSSLTSQVPSRHSAKPSTHRNSRHGSQNGWGGSQQSWGSQKARVNDDAWGGSVKHSASGWGSKHGSSKSHTKSSPQTIEYQNVQNEDNQTYVTANWDATLVGAGSRQPTLAGWE